MEFDHLSNLRGRNNMAAFFARKKNNLTIFRVFRREDNTQTKSRVNTYYYLYRCKY
jgi:hypothetical protein